VSRGQPENLNIPSKSAGWVYWRASSCSIQTKGGGEPSGTPVTTPLMLRLSVRARRMSMPFRSWPGATSTTCARSLSRTMDKKLRRTPGARAGVESFGGDKTHWGVRCLDVIFPRRPVMRNWPALVGAIAHAGFIQLRLGTTGVASTSTFCIGSPNSSRTRPAITARGVISTMKPVTWSPVSGRHFCPADGCSRCPRP